MNVTASRFLMQNARVVVQHATAACLNEDYDRKMLASVVMGLMIMLNNTVEACEEEEEDETGLESGSEEEDYYECKCSQCTSPIRCRARFRGEEYDLGWSDGYFEAGIDLDMAENEAYMDGYLQGRDEACEEEDAKRLLTGEVE